MVMQLPSTLLTNLILCISHLALLPALVFLFFYPPDILTWMMTVMSAPPSHPLKIFSHHLATQTNWVEEHSYRSNDGYPRAHLYQFVLRVLPF